MTETAKRKRTDGETGEVRAFLASAGEALMEYQRCRVRVEMLESRAERITAVTGRMSGQGGRGPEALWAALADERERELAAAGEELERYRQVEALIDALDKPLHRVVLRLRYLRYLTWRQVRQELKRAGHDYEERQIFRIHGEALKEARRIREQSGWTGAAGRNQDAR